MNCGCALGRNSRGQHDDGAIKPHLHLQITLRSAVIGPCARGRRGERISDGSAGSRLLRQEATNACRGSNVEAWEQNRSVPGREGQIVGQSDRDIVALVNDQRRTGHLHIRAEAARDCRRLVARWRAIAAIAPRVDRRTIGLREIFRFRGQVKGWPGDSRNGSKGRRREKNALLAQPREAVLFLKLPYSCSSLSLLRS